MNMKQPAPPLLDPAVHAELLQVVERHAGLHLAPHQAHGLDQTVADLAATTMYHLPQQLAAALLAAAEPNLLDELAARLTIGETHFFRIAPQIEALRTFILP